MLGAILGDIVGSAYEFNNTKDYGFQLFTRGTDYTDDSILTLAVAYWLLQDPTHQEENLVSCLVAFGYAFPYPTGSYGSGFAAWLSAKEHHPYHSWGNGSAMRVSAVGWACETLEETERVAAISAQVTHNHPEGIKGAQATAAAIFLARTGHSKEEIRDYITTRFGYDLSLSWDFLHENYVWDSSCQGTVPEAIICFLRANDFEDAIRRAVSIGGDSDTLACITGGIAEAYYKQIPDFMIQRAMELLPASLKQVLDEFAEKTVAYGQVWKDMQKK